MIVIEYVVIVYVSKIIYHVSLFITETVDQGAWLKTRRRYS